MFRKGGTRVRELDEELGSPRATVFLEMSFDLKCLKQVWFHESALWNISYSSGYLETAQHHDRYQSRSRDDWFLLRLRLSLRSYFQGSLGRSPRLIQSTSILLNRSSCRTVVTAFSRQRACARASQPRPLIALRRPGDRFLQCHRSSYVETAICGKFSARFVGRYEVRCPAPKLRQERSCDLASKAFTVDDSRF